MAVSPRKHTVPAGGERPERAAINRALASVNDIVPVANTTERAQLVADLTADGQPPTAARPLYVHRADMSAVGGLEYTINGTTWIVVSSYDTGWIDWAGVGGWGAASGNSPQVRQIGRQVVNRGALTRVGGAVTANFTGVSAAVLPGSIAPPPGGREVQSSILSNISNLGWRLIGTDLRIRAHSGSPSLTTNSYFTLDDMRWLAD